MGRARTISIFFLNFVLPRACCTNGTEFPLEGLGSASGSAEPSTQSLVNLSNKSLESFISIWNELHSAIETTIQKYESQHKVTIKVDWRLEKTNGLLEDAGSLYKTLRLQYSFQKDGQDRKSSVFIQIPHMGPNFSKEQKLLLSAKEKYMYEKVLPLMYNSWPHEKFTPEFYASTNESHVLVIENLRETGYFKRSAKLFGTSECKQVFKTLAQFHALSVVRLDEVYFGLDSLTVTDRVGLRGDADALLIYEKFRKYVAPSLSEAMRKQFELVVQNHRFIINGAHSPNLDGFNVIVHGNLSWATAFVQQDDSFNVTNCKLVDFQQCRRGSPVIDLMNFLLTSFKMVKFEDSRELFIFYVEELQKAFREGGGGDQCPYSMDELYSDLQKHKHYFIIKIIVNGPVHWNRLLPIPRHADDVHEHFFKLPQYIASYKTWMSFFKL